MRRRVFNLGLWWLVTIALVVPVSAQRGPARAQAEAGSERVCQSQIANVPTQDVDLDEATGLTFMREEEKLARDVYRKLYEIWRIPIFSNIALSEQRHFDALGVLIQRYQLPDPALEKAYGEFTDSRLSVLYGDLVDQGQISPTAALRVGATIEDLDIRDLGEAIKGTDNEDLKIVYGNLQRGSRNHLRAFVGQLEAIGEHYAAQYMDPLEMEAVLSTPSEWGWTGPSEGGGPRGQGRSGYGCPWGKSSPDRGPNCPL